MAKGRQAASSAEKPITIYEIIKDDTKALKTRAGSAVGEEMKKDLLKQIHLLKVT